MPNPPLTLHRSEQALTTATDKSTHFELIKQAIPSWLLKTSASRVKALKTVRLTLPEWHRNGSAAAHQNLKNKVQQAWNAQNDVDQMLSHLQDVYAFAKPLLQQALKNRFGVDDDVEETWLRLYVPGAQTRTVSVLDAALHNFASDETFASGSEFITRPNERGHFAVKKLKHKISIDQFKSLCRELNIGSRYEQHLRETLLSTNPVASNVLRYKVILNQKRALEVAAHMALMKKDISQQGYDITLGLLEGRESLRWHGQPVGYYTLVMMDTALSGIVLITHQSLSGTTPAPLIAYVPHDPEHPLKEYPSSLEFMAELTRQLRNATPDTNYRQFFSRFVAHHQRGHFFARLSERLSQVKWRPAPPGSNLPSWRETPVDNPDLQFHIMKFKDDRQIRYTGDPWEYVYQTSLNKILNDAREIAISTEYADRMARWAWWDNLEKILSDILDVALMVVTPFVPGLGEMMLAYTAYQLTDEVVEGLVDLAEGRAAEAGEQAIGVLESVVQLGVFAAGGAIGNVARAKLSPFFESLKPVQLANGQTRLWNPDLSPYQLKTPALPTDAKPDALGLYPHQDQHILRLEDQHFEVKKDPVTGQHRIQHPQRADAYAPTLRHNGQGAWVSETENPREWQGPTLMRRIGHTTHAFNNEQLEQIRQISGTHEAALRRMHMDNASPPPLLTDTLQRLGSSAPKAPALPADTSLLFSEFPDLPGTVAEKILANASAKERQQIKQNKRLPLRLKNQARELQFETQSARAAHGLYDDALSNIDTERLVLGTLRINSDTFGDLRIEIREGTFDGELRCSAGPEQASRVRVLIRDNAGKYAVRDGADQPIHAAVGFFEAMLQATARNGQNALGYKPGDAERFRQWVMAKIEPLNERRTILAAPPIRAVAEHQTVLLVRGAFTSRAGETLHERILDLHPDFSDSEVEAFADALIAKGEPMQAIEQREDDLDELRVILNRWEYQQEPTWGPGSNEFRDGGGQHIAERLIDSFQRKTREIGNRANPDEYSLDLSREMLPLNLETWWAKRPPELQKFLDRITVLKLDNTRFSAEANGLLKAFPNLRQLSARRCELTSLPKSIGALHRMERLQLSDNAIVLDANAVEQLKALTYLEILRLDGNPLTLSPDIGRMPRLKVVALKKTGLTTWPEGTLAKTRPRGFLLDLRDNPIGQIPEVVAGSPQAWVVARTRLDVANLSELNQLRYQDIRRSLKLPPEPLGPPHSEATVAINITDPNTWTDVPGWGVDRATHWIELTDDPQSHRFLSVVHDTKNSADYRRGGEARKQLVQRVVRMLDAVYIDTDLRQKLYTMAIAPVDCADAGAQLFNHMGINVLASEAWSYSTDPVQLEQKLVTLAKGAARLEHVNEIARADVASRGGNPDDVEIYLAYQTGLADRLKLPWQSKGMLFRPVSGVTDAMIDQAYETVLALGEGDGLVDKMLEQQFWQDYLERTWPTQIETNKQLFQNKFDALTTLRSTQRKWVESTSDLQRAQLRNRLKELMNDLPVPATVVFADEPISEATFDRLLVDLGDDEKQLSRRLTRDALKKAGQ
ncbi:NEL-type E3 ubiquitin ligase domain-containing protein [Pseudomonas laurylsulfatiphila]|uniref:NEL-type E3 ubiquitin ligase domain-containing protein n=1 Tax=Pseudomonas laurylsulfatiphila TaxID=2011015 RepID=UPI003D1E531C